tara:strand:- start:5287 stop:6672 length:1386 start_codon:yes stop_codon:yes gene_type:complete
MQDLLNVDFTDMTPAQVQGFLNDVKKEIARIIKQGDDGDAERLKKLKGITREATDFLKITDETKDIQMELVRLQQESLTIADTAADAAKNFVSQIKSQIETIPIIGSAIAGFIDFDAVGDRVKLAVLSPFANIAPALDSSKPALERFGLAFKAALGPIVAILAIIAGAITAALLKVRNLSKELGTSFAQASRLAKETTVAGFGLLGTGQDASAIAGEIVDTFGSLSNVTANNIKDIGRLATRFGAASKDIVAFQKSLTDTFGVSVNQSEAIVENVGKLAEAEGVAAGKVIADIAANTEKFAEFAKGGADGFANAAIEAAKIGSNLSAVLGAADKLLDFESSLTNEFEAQVITGKSFNLERARQLALQGEIGQLSQELASQVGSLGDIQAMNVIERRSIASAIGVSADDLMKIARGEAVQAEETVQDLQKKTNDILKAGFSKDEEKLNELINQQAQNRTIYE